MMTFIVGLIWGAAIGIVLSLWCFVRYLENLQRDLRERISALETRERESRVVISDAAIAAVNQRIVDDLFGDEWDGEDAVIH